MCKDVRPIHDVQELVIAAIFNAYAKDSLEKLQLGNKTIVSFLTMFKPKHSFLVHKTYFWHLYSTQRSKTLYKFPVCWFKDMFKDLELEKIQKDPKALLLII
jgi:hypothetical protein